MQCVSGARYRPTLPISLRLSSKPQWDVLFDVHIDFDRRFSCNNENAVHFETMDYAIDEPDEQNVERKLIANLIFTTLVCADVQAHLQKVTIDDLVFHVEELLHIPRRRDVSSCKPVTPLRCQPDKSVGGQGWLVLQ